ncbi:hypothetical protein MMC21_004373 [Puttea exsequens]|nr:hypothetical protein [Puttea exsequens]
MSNLQNFVHKRYQSQTDPQRQALARQLKVAVPQTKLGMAQLRLMSPSINIISRPDMKNDVHKHACIGGVDAFETDAEGIDDTIVSSFGRDVRHHQQDKYSSGHNSNNLQRLAVNDLKSEKKTRVQLSRGDSQRGGCSRRIYAEQSQVADAADNYEYSEDEEDNEHSAEGSEDGEFADEHDNQDECHLLNKTVQLHPGIGGLTKLPIVDRRKHAGMIGQMPFKALTSQVHNPSTQAPRRYDEIDHPQQCLSQDVVESEVPRSSARAQNSSTERLPSSASDQQIIVSETATGRLSACDPVPLTKSPNAQVVQPSTGIATQAPSRNQRSVDLHRKLNGTSFEATNIQNIFPDQYETGASPLSREIYHNVDVERAAGPGMYRLDSEKDTRLSIDHRSTERGHDDLSMIEYEDENLVDSISGSHLSVRKRDNPLDYSLDQLSAMPFEQLKSEHFNHDPNTTASATRERFANVTLAKRLEHMLKLKNDGSKAFEQESILSSLTLEEYRECGNLIVIAFSKVVTRFMTARQQRREILARFEVEVAVREQRVCSKKAKVDKDLGRLKRGGEDVVRGKDDCFE